ncbi:MAG: DegT/DnrJ/EryC1/StrS family aminotransferase [Acidobacteriia bacterium]|nr:DegT/DnrJ/EryC1/StrS family aminotransferase [Terriglobia bacterium]
MNVPFVDLSAIHKPLAGEFAAVFQRVLERSTFVLGPEVQEFESAFAAYLGVDHCVTTNNGTTALQLVLAALGIGPGDEVITVTNTFIATAEAISAVGAKPVFVDVDPVSYNMDPVLAEKAITPRTRALLPVHLYGQCADLDALADIARRRNLHLVEDACQAHGSEYKGRKAGTMGVAGCFSFYPGKNLGALGEGGAVSTSDAALAQKMRMLRDHGSLRKYEHAIPGYNFRLEGMQGGFLRVKLPHLDGWNEQRREVAALYSSKLKDSGIVAPKEMPYGKHIYHLYVVQVDNRDSVQRDLGANGVATGLHYPVPLHLQQAYKDLGYREGDFPVSEKLARRILSLPIYPGLSTDAAEYVVSKLLECAQCRMAAVAAR